MKSILEIEYRQVAWPKHNLRLEVSIGFLVCSGNSA